MRQAIEEGFILDVLANYTTYETYCHLEKAVADDPALRDRERPRRRSPGSSTLHEHNLAQKAEIIVEHFRTHVAPKIGGQAKAMVVVLVTAHAVRSTRRCDQYVTDARLRPRRAGGLLRDGRRRRCDVHRGRR